jgi:hypothetical protein
MEDGKETRAVVGSASEVTAAYSHLTDKELELMYRRCRMAWLLREGKKVMEDAG